MYYYMLYSDVDGNSYISQRSDKESFSIYVTLHTL